MIFREELVTGRARVKREDDGYYKGLKKNHIIQVDGFIGYLLDFEKG